MIVLGIESTAHTFGVSVVSEDPPFILSDIRRFYATKSGGILPREASSFFSKIAGEAVREAVEKAGVSVREIDAIAVALGPGMGPQLRVGASVARALASYYSKPLVPVNHAVAHLEIARFTTGLLDPIALYVAGGNTAVVSYVAGRYRVFGETLDIALGNLLDTFAREAGLAPPYVIGGEHVVDAYARGGSYLKNLFPYVVKGQDVSFSGLLTAALKALKAGFRIEDVCYTLREIAYSSVVEVLERGLAHTEKREVTITGGVAASKVLVEKVRAMAELHGAEFKPVEARYAGDNAAMIALTGLFAFKSGLYMRDVKNAHIRQRWRLDDVDVPWYYSLPAAIIARR
ncbi:MAG: KEOPS complex N(6)-L-threonylcarbamoyladenine synthase Kae1 [Acidilobaceae archaeon]